MSEVTLDEILVAAHDAEFSQNDNISEHFFSQKHNCAMKRIFNAYEKRIAFLNSDVMNKKNVVPHFRWNRKTVIVVLVMILLAVLVGCSAIIYHLGGFKTAVHTDNTQLFPIELEGCPQMIESMYYLPELPEEFELLETGKTDYSVYTAYRNSKTGKTITIYQSVKTIFEPHYNTEHSDLEKISIDEYTGIGLQSKEFYLVAWDNGDYIIELIADLSKLETIDLAKSAKVLEN